jgi:IS30 family transposase
MTTNERASNARLTLQERYIIQRLLHEGHSCNEIAKLIGRGKNTIVVEVRRAGGREKYEPEKAQRDSDKRYIDDRHAKSHTLKERAKTERYFNPYISLKERIENLEMQIEILTDTIKQMRNQ